MTAMSDATPQFSGVQFRDHDVRLAVTPDEAIAASHAHRTRLLDTVRSLAPDEWSAQSRCSEWSVQDVVRHLTHVNTVQLASIAAGRAGERFDGFSPANFNPKVTPAEYLRAAGPEDVATSLEGFETTTAQVLAAVDDLRGSGDDVLVSTPIGRQPWYRAVLHALFDSAVHERDIVAVLPDRPAPAPSEDEVRAIASYQVLIVARILAAVGAPVDLDLDLRGGPHLHVLVDGPVVSVLPLTPEQAADKRIEKRTVRPRGEQS